MLVKEIDSLSNTARNFFCFILAFGIKVKLRNFVNIWMIEDRLQDLSSSTCSIFRLYFSITCSALTKTVKYQTIQSLQKKTIEKLLNKLFSLNDQDSNEKKLNSMQTSNAE